MIPYSIIQMVNELTCGRNDGYTEQGIKKNLEEIRDFINNVLEKKEGYHADPRD